MLNFHSKNSTLTVKRTPWLLYALILGMVLLFSWLIEKNINLPSLLIISVSIVSLIALFFVGITRPEIALFILTAYLPFNRILVGDFGGFTTAVNITNAIIFIIVIGWFVKAFNGHYRLFSKNTLSSPIILFCLFCLVSLIKGSLFAGSDYFMDFIVPLKRWLTPVFLFFLAVNVIRSKEDIRKMVIIMTIAITIAGLMAIYEYLDVGPNSSLDRSRVGGICEQPNMLGGFFVSYMFIIVAFLLMHYKTIKYYLLTFPITTCIYGVLVTFSRGAYLGLAVGFWTISYFRNKILWVLLTIYLISAYLNPHLLPPGMRYRLVESTFNPTIYDTGIEDQLEGSARTRLVVWRGALDIIKDYPIFGVGYGLFPYVIPYYAPTENKLLDAHNTYIIIAAEMGIPALIMFLIIFFILIKNARYLYRKSKDPFMRTLGLGVLAGIFGLMVVNMFGSRMNSEEVSGYFWILAGLVMRAVIIEKNSHKVKLVK